MTQQNPTDTTLADIKAQGGFNINDPIDVRPMPTVEERRAAHAEALEVDSWVTELATAGLIPFSEAYGYYAEDETVGLEDMRELRKAEGEGE